MRMRIAVRGCLVAVCLSGAACGDRADRAESAAATERPVTVAATVPLTEIQETLGLDFVHQTGSTDRYAMPAVMTGGAALFDFDGDDLLDVYLVNAGDQPPDSGRPSSVGNRLFRQASDGTFEDVTAEAGVGDRSYGMGAAVGDVDNDGWLDLFVSNWGPDRFYRNRGDGTFEEATATAGLGGGDGWSASAVFFDLDRDGWLDLWVTRYVDWDPGRECALEGGRLDFCGPAQFPGLSDLLYRNRGDGTFEEISRRAGLSAAADRGLGVVASDFDGDGWVDVYVANDADPNHLWINRRDGSFVDDALLLGLAFNRFGVGEAGMGVALSDPDEDGDLDLFVSHLIEETNTLYENLGAAGFEDATASRGLGVPSMPYTGFGTAWLDIDNDGDEDLAVANGAIKRRPTTLRASVGGTSDSFWAPYAEPNLFFLNDGSGHFVDASAGTGAFGERIEISRGLIPGDIDRDGDLDLLVTNIEGPVRLYRNDADPGRGRSIEIRAIDPELGREAIGARLVVVSDRRRRVRDVIPPAGYLTSGHARVHLGLLQDERIESIEVRWPSGDRPPGETERFPVAETERVITLRRGAGDAVE